MRRVKHWQGGSKALRRPAAASEGFRRIMDYEYLWIRLINSIHSRAATTSSYRRDTIASASPS